MESNYTSLELSKRLAEAGCGIKSNANWLITNDDSGWKIKNYSPLHLGVFNDHPKYGFRIQCPAYDILNDICCKYAKEFFGEEDVCWKCGKSYKEWGKVNYCEACRRCEHNKKRWEFVSKTILELIQQGKKQEVEDYIWEHCLFNKEVKHGK